jgi:hypothetical protein
MLSLGGKDSIRVRPRRKTAMKLDGKTQDAFEMMIDDSIVERYDGDLDRL